VHFRFALRTRAMHTADEHDGRDSMRFAKRSLALALAALVMTSAPAMAQPSPEQFLAGIKRLPSPVEAGAIPLYSGAAPGSEAAKQREVWTEVRGEWWARNVTRPTLTPFLPKPGTATGAAVLVIPGGGFRFVSMSNEGWPIATWLAERGIAAFVLKYRTMETPDAEADFGRQMLAMFTAPRSAGPDLGMAAATEVARADAQTALRLIRARAAEWGVDSKRVGMLGFSAGAMTTMATALANAPDARPDFIAPIYGQMTAVTPPSSPQPLFVALASDDMLFNQQGFGLVESWQKAGGAVELHYYAGGGHGFGSHRQNTTSDLWFGQFLAWLEAKGLLKPAG
jgi:acetyl esterase/lipase